MEYDPDASDREKLMGRFLELGHSITLLIRSEGDEEENFYHASVIAAKCSAISEISKRMASIEKDDDK